MQEAAFAAQAHDTLQVLNIINRLAPKSVKKRIHLQSTDGHTLRPVEAHPGLLQQMEILTGPAMCHGVHTSDSGAAHAPLYFD